MTYLLCQIWFCLLIATLLGFVLGWWLRARRCEAEITDILRRQRDALRLRDNRIEELRAAQDTPTTASAQKDTAAKPRAKTTAKRAPAKATPKAKSPARKAAKPTQATDKPAVLLDTAPAKPDDLKQISGVGPKLEQLLNNLGVYQFAQVAKFTKQDIAWIDQHLGSFKGRIERDGWVKQAKALAKQ